MRATLLRVHQKLRVPSWHPLGAKRGPVATRRTHSATLRLTQHAQACFGMASPARGARDCR